MHIATCEGFRCRVWGMHFCYYCFVFVGPQSSLPPMHLFLAVLQVQPGIRMAMGPSPPGGASRPHVDIEGLADFFAFLQCSLRMEAQECLGLELGLEDPRAGLMWPHFVDWLGQGLGKREKWMPFHTILGTHELFAVEKIHQNTDWDMHRRFLHCLSTVHIAGRTFSRPCSYRSCIPLISGTTRVGTLRTMAW